MKLSRAKLLLLLLVFAACVPGLGRADEANALVWQADQDSVSADIHGEELRPLLEDIAHQTGWHIFVEPGASHHASVKFRNLRPGAALQKLLGTLNYALVPETNGPQELYVFSTTIQRATQRVTAAPVIRKHVANQLMVKLKPGADIDAIAKARGAKVVSRNDKMGIYLLEFSDAATTDAALASLKTDSDVALVDYNYIFTPPATPQPLASVPVGAGPLSLTLDPSTTSDPCAPIVGLIDTGMQSLGSQLDKFVKKSINVTGDTTTLSATVPTHATTMGYTILNGALQQIQASKGASQQRPTTSMTILPVDVFGKNETANSYNVALGVQAAVDNGATILNMSLAGSTDGAVLDDIIQQALAKGVVIFAAAGNQPVTTPNYPAAIPGVNAVTALSGPGQLASYANYGNFVEMALPGTSVIYMGDQAWVVQGTSPATAFASGVAAGIKGVNCQPWAQIQQAMAQKFPVPAKTNP